MVDKIRCDICNVEISKTNWSKHIKTKKHLERIRDREVNEETNEKVRAEQVLIKHCGICNVVNQRTNGVNILNQLLKKGTPSYLRIK
jgi:hypothetical protein